MDFLKNVLGGLAALVVGLMIASYFGDPKNPSPIGAVVNAWGSLRNSITTTFNPPSPEDLLASAALPDGTAILSDSQKKEAEKYFEISAGVSPTQEKQDQKKKEDKDPKETSQPDQPVPPFLFPIKKQSTFDSMDHGAVYNGGTSPYGPPPAIKSKIFAEDTILSVSGDPTVSKETPRNYIRPYRKPNTPSDESSMPLALPHPFNIEKDVV